MPTAPPVHRPRGSRASVQSKVAVRAKTVDLGYDWRWRKASHGFLMRFPLCAPCQAKGRITAATEVDHVQPHRGDQSLFWSEDNWQPICKPCHSRKTSSEVRGSVSLLPSWIGRIDRPFTVVAGPPASGKTTYVKKNANPSDLILDADDIAVEIGIADSRNGGRAQQFLAAIRERNAKLADYARGRTKHPKCWLIATAGSFKQRKFWTDIGADVIVVNPGAEVCRSRIRAEQSTDAAKRSRLQAVDRWA